MHNYLKFAIIDANNTADLQKRRLNYSICGRNLKDKIRGEREKGCGHCPVGKNGYFCISTTGIGCLHEFPDFAAKGGVP